MRVCATRSRKLIGALDLLGVRSGQLLLKVCEPAAVVGLNGVATLPPLKMRLKSLRAGCVSVPLLLDASIDDLHVASPELDTDEDGKIR